MNRLEELDHGENIGFVFSDEDVLIKFNELIIKNELWMVNHKQMTEAMLIRLRNKCEVILYVRRGGVGFDENDNRSPYTRVIEEYKMDKDNYHNILKKLKLAKSDYLYDIDDLLIALDNHEN